MNRSAVFLLIATVCAVAPQLARAAGCTNADLQGSYGYQLSGWVAPAPGQALVPFSETGRLAYTADGTLSGAGAFTFGGGQVGTHTFTGTAQVNADCTATIPITDNFGISGDFFLVILQSGKDYLIQNVSPGTVIQGRAERMIKNDNGK